MFVRKLKFHKLVDHIASIASNSELQKKASRHKLAIQNITWEDTGR